MQEDPKDPHLGPPGEANTDKHINFLADEQGDEQRRNEKVEESRIFVTDNSTLQTPEEDRHDKSIDPRQDTSVSVSGYDLRESAADRVAGSDRAGTAERKA